MTRSDWQPIETAPDGYDGKRFHSVLFRGTSRGGSFAGYAYVSGWMDRNRQPVHSYGYKLNITHWMPLPPAPSEDAVASPVAEGKALPSRKEEQQFAALSPDPFPSPQDAVAVDIGAAVVRYMAEHMAMPAPLDDQEQNWICGHMHTFAAQLLGLPGGREFSTRATKRGGPAGGWRPLLAAPERAAPQGHDHRGAAAAPRRTESVHDVPRQERGG